jgi:hypothetical protein
MSNCLLEEIQTAVVDFYKNTENIIIGIVESDENIYHFGHYTYGNIGGVYNVYVVVDFNDNSVVISNPELKMHIDRIIRINKISKVISELK